MEKTHEKLAIRVSRNTLSGNIVLSTAKLFAGIYSNSAAMISDAVHSFSDVLADLIVIVGVKMAGKQSDKEHPYGHERMECVAGILISFILFAVGAIIGWSGLRKILEGNFDELLIPGIAALIMAVVSIVVKEMMFWYTRGAAKKTGSVALNAAAWHHRSDAMSSVGSFAGILGARLGFPILDTVASVVICVFIIKVSIGIFFEAVNRMIDKACDDETIDKIKIIIMQEESVIGIDRLHTRLFGNRIFIEVDIGIDETKALNEAHDIAQKVHDAIESELPRVKHCTVHVNPHKKTG